jgi:hypothetical protein
VIFAVFRIRSQQERPPLLSRQFFFFRIKSLFIRQLEAKFGP